MSKCLTAKTLIAVVLAISLAANIYLGGMLLGQKEHRGYSGAAGFMYAELKQTIAALPQPARAQAEQILATGQQERRAAFRKLRERRKELQKIFAAEPFSPQAAATAFSQLRQDMITAQQMAHEMMVNIAPTIPADQRAKLFESRKWKGKDATDASDMQKNTGKSAY